MPAAENTNNFWNLGEENRGFSRNGIAGNRRFCPQITQILKEEGINSYESRRMRKIWPDTRCLPRHGEVTWRRAPNFVFWAFGVF